MNHKRASTPSILISGLTFLFLFCTTCHAQVGTGSEPHFPANEDLYDTIIVQDSIFFQAFNSRDFDKFKSFLSENLEIYQDNTGFRNYEQSLEAFKSLFSKEYVLTRTMIRESVEIYPIKDYGAIETGQHTFCHMENGKPDCGTFKFMHIWIFQNGQWKITRIVTYNHKL